MKKCLLCLILGIAIGLWPGYNLGRGAEIFSNPFGAETVQQQLGSAWKEGREEFGESLKKLGNELKGSD